MSSPALTEKQAYWLNHIQQCEQKNLTAPVYCNQHNLKVSQLHSYKHELRRKGFLQAESTTAFTKAIVKPPHKTATVRAHPVSFSLSMVWGTFRLQITTGGPLS